MPVHPMSAGFCMDGTKYYFMYSFSNTLVTLFATNCLESTCLFNQCKTTLLSVHRATDLILQRSNAAFTFSIKFEAMCAETSGKLGMVSFFLEIRDLITNL